jgi:hypothetical protein
MRFISDFGSSIRKINSPVDLTTVPQIPRNSVKSRRTERGNLWDYSEVAIISGKFLSPLDALFKLPLRRNHPNH